jgi:8-oxo-dGTP pyrophosphatase MutT (NUDIX family)
MIITNNNVDLSTLGVAVREYFEETNLCGHYEEGYITSLSELRDYIYGELSAELFEEEFLDQYLDRVLTRAIFKMCDYYKLENESARVHLCRVDWHHINEEGE